MRTHAAERRDGLLTATLLLVDIDSALDWKRPMA
jgi:hypothetical protein